MMRMITGREETTQDACTDPELGVWPGSLLCCFVESGQAQLFLVLPHWT